MNYREANLIARNAAPVVGTYICNDPDRPCGADHFNGSHPQDRQCWHESCRRRLEWQGGPSANAAADISAWNRLGSSKRAAA